jgi:Nucleotidyl transferase AbiEii toxin, Type IV TA system
MEARQRRLAFLVIGGHAVNLYGFSRETADLDFLVCSDDRPSWTALFTELGYRIFSESQNFVQLASDKETGWPVYLMFVRPATFQPTLEDSRVMEFYGSTARVPTLEHLIALKLHAIKNTQAHRFLKDFLDVENLIRTNNLDIKSENIRRLFEKYATLELYERMSATLRSGE